MRREVLQAAASRVEADIRESGLFDMFATATEQVQRSPASERDSVNWVNIISLADYLGRVGQYGAAEKRVSQILNIGHLGDPETWQLQFNSFNIEFIYQTYNNLRQIAKFLQSFINLLDREYDNFNNVEGEGDLIEKGLSVQTIILSDEGDALSSPNRLIELLSSITQIYAVLAEIQSVPTDSLAVVAMDSGSEKSFDFLGLAKIMTELRETLQWIYNIVVFHKHNVTMKNLQIAGETLSVINKINKLEVGKSINSEDAARMRHVLFSGLERFAGTGAYITEMSANSKPPSLAMRPQPRLLTAPADEIVRKSNDATQDEPSAPAPSKTAPTDVSDFSAEQIAEAVSLLRSAEKNLPVAGRSTSARKLNRTRPSRVDTKKSD